VVVLLQRELSQEVRPTSLDIANECEPEVTDDAAVSPSTSAGKLVYSCLQYVVYSPTFQVPAFYFVIHDTSAYGEFNSLAVT
jgi:hypothetical protein